MKLAAALVLVLIGAAPAASTCSWVFWTETKGPKRTSGFSEKGPWVETAESDVWDIGEAFASQQTCQAAARRKLKAFEALHRAQDDKTPAVVSGDTIAMPSNVGPGLVICRFACFPDTVDPRGPKGN